MKARVCIGCGCTDLDPCIDPETGEPCSWVMSAALDGDICSACASIDEEEDQEQQPMVELFSEAQANAFLRSRA